jgi:ATP-GRASP peptide maturase of grasp-with-spasm system
MDLNNNMFIVKKNNTLYNLFDVESIWFRRRGFSMNTIEIDQEKLDQAVLFDDIDYHKRHVNLELNIIIDFAYSFLNKQKNFLGGFSNKDSNKLMELETAKKVGLRIPRSYIVTNKQDLKELLIESKKDFITKALSNGIYQFTKKYGYYSYTEKITSENVDSFPEHFFPSLVQEEIKKKYELRVFCLNDEFYPMAIFSQNKDLTKIDFRKQNSDSPIRFVPYLLPTDVKQLLKEFLKKFSLNTGSIDLIVDENGNYIFLEINPVGQFGMTSRPCNYFLEKKIAETL